VCLNVNSMSDAGTHNGAGAIGDRLIESKGSYPNDNGAGPRF